MKLIEAMMNVELTDNDKDYMLSNIVSREEGMEEAMDSIEDTNKLNVVEDPKEMYLSIDSKSCERTYEKKGIVNLACATTQVEKDDEMSNENYILFQLLLVYEYASNANKNYASMEKKKHSKEVPDQ